jgi:hypothetical protein
LKDEKYMTNNEIPLTPKCPDAPRRKVRQAPGGRGQSGFAPGLLSLAILLALFWCGCVSQRNATPHPAAPHLVGRISGNSYTSSEGHFTVPFPVSAEQHGRVIRDDAQSVTFYDDWGNKISFYSKPISPRSPLITPPQSEARGKALETLMRDIYGNAIVTHYHPEVLDGTLSFIFPRLVGPKTGVATFVARQRVYLVETDYLPGMQLLSNNDEAADQAQNRWLENRATDLLRSMETR